MKVLLMFLMVLATHGVPAGAAPDLAPLPGNSVYQSQAQLTDAKSRQFAWASKRGQVQIVSMFYTSCKFVCPMLIEGGKAIDQQLTADERARVGVTLISLDPKRDTPAALARTERERTVDSARWTLARPEPKDVRSIAGLLGVRYRALADGEFNHTTVLVLLDVEGRVMARTENIGGVPDAAFVAAVKRALANPASAGAVPRSS